MADCDQNRKPAAPASNMAVREVNSQCQINVHTKHAHKPEVQAKDLEEDQSSLAFLSRASTTHDDIPSEKTANEPIRAIMPTVGVYHEPMRSCRPVRPRQVDTTVLQPGMEALLRASMLYRGSERENSRRVIRAERSPSLTEVLKGVNDGKQPNRGAEEVNHGQSVHDVRFVPVSERSLSVSGPVLLGNIRRVGLLTSCANSRPSKHIARRTGCPRKLHGSEVAEDREGQLWPQSR
jgi:hypothetical protein